MVHRRLCPRTPCMMDSSTLGTHYVGQESTSYHSAGALYSIYSTAAVSTFCHRAHSGKVWHNVTDTTYCDVALFYFDCIAIWRPSHATGITCTENLVKFRRVVLVICLRTKQTQTVVIERALIIIIVQRFNAVLLHDSLPTPDCTDW